MAKTLVISVDDEHIGRAEELAASYGMSVTEWAEQLVRLATPARRATDDLPPITKSALGLLKDDPNRSYKEQLTEALMEKFGIHE